MGSDSDLRTLIAPCAIVDTVTECLDNPYANWTRYNALDEGPGAASEIALSRSVETFSMTSRSENGISKIEMMLRHARTIFFDEDPGEEFDIGINTYLFLAGVPPEVSDEQVT